MLTYLELQEIKAESDALIDQAMAETPDAEPAAPTRSCGNCQHWFSTQWYRSIGDGLTGYCDQANQNRHSTQVCPGHEWVDEF